MELDTLRDLECERCGHCCPTTCELLRIDQEEPRMTTCLDHERFPLCRAASPLYVYRCQLACRAAMRALGIEDHPTRVTENGQVVLSSK